MQVVQCTLLSFVWSSLWTGGTGDRKVLVWVCQVFLQMPLQFLPHLALNSHSAGLFQEGIRIQEALIVR